MNLPFWIERAKQEQARILRRKTHQARQTFVIFERDLPALRLKLGPRLSSYLVVENIPHIHDVDECGRW